MSPPRTETMDEPLDYEDIGHLLEAKAEKLVAGQGDPSEVIHDILKTLSRSPEMRTREKTVDPQGRVSVGRDLSGTIGITLFHPDPEREEPGEVANENE